MMTLRDKLHIKSIVKCLKLIFSLRYFVDEVFCVFIDEMERFESIDVSWEGLIGILGIYWIFLHIQPLLFIFRF